MKESVQGAGKGRVSPAQFLEMLNDIIPGWQTEFVFYPGRRCKFDYANPAQMIAIEIEGGVWMSVSGGKSRHFTGSGATADMKKYNAAEVRGWTLLRYADNNKRLTKATVERALRDVKAILTGIDERMCGRNLTTCQAKLLSEKLGMNGEQTKQYLELLEAH